MAPNGLFRFLLKVELNPPETRFASVMWHYYGYCELRWPAAAAAASNGALAAALAARSRQRCDRSLPGTGGGRSARQSAHTRAAAVRPRSTRTVPPAGRCAGQRGCIDMAGRGGARRGAAAHINAFPLFWRIQCTQEQYGFIGCTVKPKPLFLRPCQDYCFASG